MFQKKLRFRLLVDPTFQGRTVGRLSLYWLMYHAVVWQAMFVVKFWQVRQGMSAGTMEARPFSELLSEHIGETTPLLICGALAFPLLIWDVLRLTHRVAGPLLRFQNVLDAANRGEALRPVTLRKGDYLIDFVRIFNEHVREFNQLRFRDVHRDRPETVPTPMPKVFAVQDPLPEPTVVDTPELPMPAPSGRPLGMVGEIQKRDGVGFSIVDEADTEEDLTLQELTIETDTNSVDS